MLDDRRREFPRSPVELAAEALDGPWTTRIVWSLSWGGKGFSQLLRDLHISSGQVLARELEALEARGLLERRMNRCDPRDRVEYALTAEGESLKPVVRAMYLWGLLVSGSGNGSPTRGRPSGRGARS